jgi:hypothetical protein
VSFNAYVDPLFEIPSDLPGVNPATNDKMILYYCLITKVDELLGDSMVFSWAGCQKPLIPPFAAASTPPAAESMREPRIRRWDQ